VLAALCAGLFSTLVGANFPKEAWAHEAGGVVAADDCAYRKAPGIIALHSLRAVVSCPGALGLGSAKESCTMVFSLMLLGVLCGLAAKYCARASSILLRTKVLLLVLLAFLVCCGELCC